MKTSTGPTSIMRIGSNYSDSGRGRGRGRKGRSGTNQQYVQTHAKPAEHKINTTDPKQQPGVTKQEQVHLFTLKVSPAVVETKGNSVQQIIQVMTKTIDKKSGFTVVFHPTTKRKFPPKPIANISENFPSSQADLRDFFYVRQFSTTRAEVYLAFSMPGTTQEELYASLKNTLKEYSV